MNQLFSGLWSEKFSNFVLIWKDPDLTVEETCEVRIIIITIYIPIEYAFITFINIEINVILMYVRMTVF